MRGPVSFEYAIQKRNCRTDLCFGELVVSMGSSPFWNLLVSIGEKLTEFAQSEGSHIMMPVGELIRWQLGRCEGPGKTVKQMLSGLATWTD